MAQVTLDGVRKIYSEQGKTHVAVQAMDLSIADGEFVVLVGPSGCGKSTTLRMIAGLESVTAGTLRIGDRVVNDVAARDRDIAMVFQNYALYPHMSVYDNLAFALTLKKVPRAEIDRRVKEAASLLAIDEMLDRRPRQLSGGQRQRVAVGRAIVRQPQVFLFDEPLSNLDAKLRIQMRREIAALRRRLGTTTVYVTHDQVEAMTLGDRIVVMRDGYVQQVDTPLGVYRKPVNAFVATFVGSPPMNLIPGTLGSDRRFVARGAALTLEGPATAAPGREIYLGIRSEDLHLVAPATGDVDARVQVVEPLGSESIVTLVCGDLTLSARLEGMASLQHGSTVGLAMRAPARHWFDGTTEQRL